MLISITSLKKNKFFHFKKSSKSGNEPVKNILKTLFWFSLGMILGFFFFISFIYIIYQKTHTKLIYTGVFVDNQDFSDKTKEDVKKYFSKKNDQIKNLKIHLQSPSSIATISAQDINFGYDQDLLSEQAFSIGRSNNLISNLSIITQAFFNGIHLQRAWRISDGKLDPIISKLKKENDIKPVNALFTFENGRVSSFNLATNGRAVDSIKLRKQIYNELISAVVVRKPYLISLSIPINIVKPDINNENVNNLGIKELIAQGTSLFAHSIENRIYNINLAAGRLNGILVAPGEVFSFNKTLGDISILTGFKQAYVIENGRTVLGDGGGVCQVSTTLFRAAIAAGLPIIERNPHAYRVGYYEQDTGPGVDAAVYSPSVDLKFKNDTGHHILIQSYIDNADQRLTFALYGTKDNREIVINDPVILSQTPAPGPLYQDDPTLPKGVEKQVDFAATGARVYFTRVVIKDGKEILNDKFSSNYRPWQAIFLRGTKE